MIYFCIKNSWMEKIILLKRFLVRTPSFNAKFIALVQKCKWRPNDRGFESFSKVLKVRTYHLKARVIKKNFSIKTKKNKNHRKCYLLHRLTKGRGERRKTFLQCATLRQPILSHTSILLSSLEAVVYTTRPACWGEWKRLYNTTRAVISANTTTPKTPATAAITVSELPDSWAVKWMKPNMLGIYFL